MKILFLSLWVKYLDMRENVNVPAVKPKFIKDPIKPTLV